MYQKTAPKNKIYINIGAKIMCIYYGPMTDMPKL